MFSTFIAYKIIWLLSSIGQMDKCSPWYLPEKKKKGVLHSALQLCYSSNRNNHKPNKRTIVCNSNFWKVLVWPLGYSYTGDFLLLYFLKSFRPIKIGHIRINTSLNNTIYLYSIGHCRWIFKFQNSKKGICFRQHSVCQITAWCVG